MFIHPCTDQTGRRGSQAGGISILVAMMLLVLLTLATLGMSRNAIRDIVSSGFARQGAMSQSVADSGIEWAVYWATEPNAPSATGSAQALQTTMTTIEKNTAMWGIPTDAIAGTQPYVPGGALQPDLQWTGANGVVQGFTLGVTFMGKVLPTNFGQGPSGLQGAYAPSAPNTSSLGDNVFAFRSDAQVVQGPVTFTNSQEAWVSNPVQ